ncbi:MAG: hypothetical protein OER80_08915 [Gammaproteobacteria bacterium]|nr:hypothetical protein [Gammaproteobacteria bacterium]MDH3766928.1 hypothetical protein [Gammaproteobacteria bacterium]
MKRNFIWTAGLTMIAVTALAFIAVRIPYGIDPLDVINIRNLQHTIGAEDAFTVRLGELVLGEFNDNWYALFVKISNFSSLKFAQIGDAWRDGVTPPIEVCTRDGSIPGCGECRVAEPTTTILGLDGRYRNIKPENNEALVVRRTAADGQIFVDDARQLASDNESLIIVHAGSHPPNHNYTPEPSVSLHSVIVEDLATSARGFVSLTFGKAGEILDMEVLPTFGSDGLALREALGRAVDTDFVDDRVHVHTVYASYELSGHRLNVYGGLVTLPRCCSDPLPPCGNRTCMLR